MTPRETHYTNRGDEATHAPWCYGYDPFVRPIVRPMYRPWPVRAVWNTIIFMRFKLVAGFALIIINGPDPTFYHLTHSPTKTHPCIHDFTNQTQSMLTVDAPTTTFYAACHLRTIMTTTTTPPSQPPPATTTFTDITYFTDLHGWAQAAPGEAAGRSKWLNR